MVWSNKLIHAGRNGILPESFSMSRLLRVALLLADKPAPSIVSTHGDYTVQFSRLLHSAIQHYKLDIDLRIHPYDVVDQMAFPSAEELKEIDGIMITGSGRVTFLKYCS
jgi:hypothetical protein